MVFPKKRSKELTRNREAIYATSRLNRAVKWGEKTRRRTKHVEEERCKKTILKPRQQNQTIVDEIYVSETGHAALLITVKAADAIQLRNAFSLAQEGSFAKLYRHALYVTTSIREGYVENGELS